MSILYMVSCGSICTTHMLYFLHSHNYYVVMLWLSYGDIGWSVIAIHSTCMCLCVQYICTTCTCTCTVYVQRMHYNNICVCVCNIILLLQYTSAKIRNTVIYLRIQVFESLETFKMYYAIICVFVSSLHRESTDSLVHVPYISIL